MPTGSTPRRYEHRSDRATSYTRSTRHQRSSPPRRLIAFPHTVTLQQCTAVAACACRTLQHHLHHLLRARWSFPTAGAVFIASSRAKCVSSSTTLPDPHARRARPQHGTHHPSRAQQRQPLPIARAPVVAPHPSPPCPAPHHPPLEASSCLAPGVRRAASPERATSATSASRRPCRLPCAATILCAHAALRSKPRPAAHPERDVHHPRRATLRPSPIVPYPPRFPRPSSAA
ncbi:hypothetical protein B0H14DRAFT_1449573 [Mycena olivaceomarginata]|nr:hypothetical protein B0H14DRAFT_1449573 [Mycena olivaceomarginata]